MILKGFQVINGINDGCTSSSKPNKNVQRLLNHMISCDLAVRGNLLSSSYCIFCLPYLMLFISEQQHIAPTQDSSTVINTPKQRQTVIPIPAQCHPLYGHELQQLDCSSSNEGSSGATLDALTENTIC